jgi:hypothetical protein
MASVTTRYLAGVHADPSGVTCAVGQTGTILHLAGAIPPPCGGLCTHPVDLCCETTVASATHGRSSTLLTWNHPPGCSGARDDLAGEVIFHLHSPVTGRIQVGLRPRGGDLDLIATGAAGDTGCAPAASCLAASQNPACTCRSSSRLKEP